MKHEEMKELLEIKKQSMEQLNKLHNKIIVKADKKEANIGIQVGEALNFYNQVFQRVLTITAQEMAQKNIDKKFKEEK